MCYQSGLSVAPDPADRKLPGPILPPLWPDARTALTRGACGAPTGLAQRVVASSGKEEALSLAHAANPAPQRSLKQRRASHPEIGSGGRGHVRFCGPQVCWRITVVGFISVAVKLCNVMVIWLRSVQAICGSGRLSLRTRTRPLSEPEHSVTVGVGREGRNASILL